MYQKLVSNIKIPTIIMKSNKLYESFGYLSTNFNVKLSHQFYIFITGTYIFKIYFQSDNCFCHGLRSLVDEHVPSKLPTCTKFNYSLMILILRII